jgi:hypothetical protein
VDVTRVAYATIELRPYAVDILQRIENIGNRIFLKNVGLYTSTGTGLSIRLTDFKVPETTISLSVFALD